MMGKHTLCLQAAKIVAVVLMLGVSGCAPGRSDYYDSLHRRREGSFERWRTHVEDEHAPHVEGVLGLDDALRLALNHSPGLLAAIEMEAQGRGRVVEAYSAALPRVTVSGGYTRLDEAPFDFESFITDLLDADQPGGGGGGGDRNRYDVSLDVTQPIYRGGAIGIAQRVARLYSYLGDEALRGAVENTVFGVSSAYYAALLAGHLVEVEDQALRSAAAQLEAVSARRVEGLARDYDVLRAHVEVSNIEASLIERRNEKEAALTSLLRAMGVSQKSSVVLSDDLDETVYAPPSFEEAVSTAFRRRPDIFQASIEVDLYREALAEVRTRYLPRLDGFFHYGQTRSSGAWDDEWRAGLRLSWTIFDGLAREGAALQQRAELRRRKILLADAEQRAIKEVRDALSEIGSAGEMVRSQKMNIERAEETQRLVEVGYEEGINTEIELLDARSALTRARGFYYRALYRRKTAELALRRALGELAGAPESSAGDNEF